MKHWIDWDVVTKIKIVATAEGSDKRVLFDEIKEKKGEGVVFKRSSAKYRIGRPASGGDYLKFKFTADCTCIVAEVNDKRSVRLSLMDGKSVVNAGNVTIPPNHKVLELVRQWMSVTSMPSRSLDAFSSQFTLVSDLTLRRSHAR